MLSWLRLELESRSLSWLKDEPGTSRLGSVELFLRQGESHQSVSESTLCCSFSVASGERLSPAEDGGDGGGGLRLILIGCCWWEEAGFMSPKQNRVLFIEERLVWAWLVGECD